MTEEHGCQKGWLWLASCGRSLSDPRNLGWAELRAPFSNLGGAVGSGCCSFWSSEYSSLCEVCSLARGGGSGRGKCPSLVLALEIIKPFFTCGQSNSVHI